jgi:hypothetical protein
MHAIYVVKHPRKPLDSLIDNKRVVSAAFDSLKYSTPNEQTTALQNLHIDPRHVDSLIRI